MGISNWTWSRPQIPEQDAGERGPGDGARTLVGRPQERQDRERQQPEHEVPRVDRVERLPDHEHRVDPEAVCRCIEPPGECGQGGGQQGHVAPSGQAPGQQVRPERDDRQPEQADQGRRGGDIGPEHPGDTGEQQVETRRVVGGQAGVRPLGRERAQQDRVGQTPVVQQVTTSVERREGPGAVDRDRDKQQDPEPPFRSRDRRHALSYTPDRSPDAAADRQVAGHAPCSR